LFYSGITKLAFLPHQQTPEKQEEYLTWGLTYLILGGLFFIGSILWMIRSIYLQRKANLRIFNMKNIGHLGFGSFAQIIYISIQLGTNAIILADLGDFILVFVFSFCIFLHLCIIGFSIERCFRHYGRSPRNHEIPEVEQQPEAAA
jgi:hypothetical protein